MGLFSTFCGGALLLKGGTARTPVNALGPSRLGLENQAGNEAYLQLRSGAWNPIGASALFRHD